MTQPNCSAESLVEGGREWGAGEGIGKCGFNTPALVAFLFFPQEF